MPSSMFYPRADGPAHLKRGTRAGARAEGAALRSRELLRAGADGCGEAGEAVGGEAGVEPVQDVADEAGAAVDEAGVELDGRGAGADLGVGVGRVEDAAGGDERDGAFEAAGERGEQPGREREERAAAQASGLARVGGAEAGRPRDGRVADNEAVD